MNDGKFTFLLALFLVFSVVIIPAVNAASCGDGSCGVGENSCSCSEDCGSCSGPVPSKSCREYYCTTEDICSIQIELNCCGNDLCETKESYGNCPADCTPKSISITVLNPDEEDQYLRGEFVNIKVRITAEGRSIASARVKATGFFGTTTLFNDGKHGDELISDDVYGTWIELPLDLESGEKEVVVSAEFIGLVNDETIKINFKPELAADFDIEGIYFLGDVIDIAGYVKAHKTGISIPLRIVFKTGEKTLHKAEINSEEDGEFRYNYHTNFLEEPGIWLVNIGGVDLNNNSVFIEKSILVRESIPESHLEIELIKKLESIYVRGQEMEFIVKVTNRNEEEIAGADVKILMGNKTVPLAEIRSGQYSGLYRIPWNEQLERRDLMISARKEEGEVLLSGSETLFVTIAPADLSIDIIEPREKRYKVGDTIPIEVDASYGSLEFIGNGTVTTLINGKEIVLNAVGIGLYEGSYYVEEEDEGEMRFEVRAEDEYGNSNFVEESILISGKSIVFDIMKNIAIIAIVGAVLISVGMITAFFIIQRRRLGKLIRRRKEVEELEIELQKRYFDETSISKGEFKDGMEKYEMELKILTEEIAKLREK
ncbi:MAG: hypothetical protein ABID38_05730 [Candidatus Diapherotrites archaeon]